MTPDQEERYHALTRAMNDAADALSAALERRDISAACAASQEQLRLHRALGVLKWEASALQGHGHDWRSDGAWWRTCARCGLRVASLVVGGTPLRTAHYVPLAEDGAPREGSSGQGAVVDDDAPVPPCADGAVGPHATFRAVAPWDHA